MSNGIRCHGIGFLAGFQETELSAEDEARLDSLIDEACKENPNLAEHEIHAGGCSLQELSTDQNVAD